MNAPLFLLFAPPSRRSGTVSGLALSSSSLSLLAATTGPVFELVVLVSLCASGGEREEVDDDDEASGGGKGVVEWILFLGGFRMKVGW